MEIIQEIKKAGNKINLLARKIEEAEKLNLTNRIYSYFEEIEKTKEKLNNSLAELRVKIQEK